jgi:hypothetical protein
MTTHNAQRQKRSLLHSLFFVLLLLSTPGCGGCRGELTGTVSFQGEPIQSGSVLLVGSDSRPITTAIKEDGSYTFPNVPTGEAKLAVYVPNLNQRLRAALRKAFAGGVEINGENGAQGLQIVISPNGGFKIGGDEPEVDLSDSYKDHERSGLRTTIERGFNSYDIELK